VAASALGAGVVAALTTAAEVLGVLPEVVRGCKHMAAAECDAGLDAPSMTPPFDDVRTTADQIRRPAGFPLSASGMQLSDL
jgi:hypothetical protein